VVRLTAIIITRNEAANIGACLDSLAFCDERIVVDSGSDDATVELARAKGAIVAEHPWQGFGPQKNFALSQATGEWVLSIDADERVSDALGHAIIKAISTDAADGYELRRHSTFLGREMLESRWFPDYVLRLFRRGRACFSDRLVHEDVVCDGPVARLSEPLLHHPVVRIEDALSRIDHYSTASATMLVAAGRRVSFATGIAHGLWMFFRMYVLRFGFLDGRIGFLFAVAHAEGSYYRYMKAWLATQSIGEAADPKSSSQNAAIAAPKRHT
jgi:glycosyltransferase involved in cell wall biosynthesis